MKGYIQKVFGLCFLFILCFIATFKLMGQQSQLIFQNLDIENGFSDNGITKIIQDKQGILWIAGRLGINRYNGNEVKVYPLPHELTINDIIIDENKIFIATSKGLYALEENQIKLIPLHSNPLIDFKEGDPILQIIRHPNKGYWLVGKGEQFYWFSSLNKPEKIKNFRISSLNPVFSHTSVMTITPDKKEGLWLGSSQGEVFHYKEKQNKLIKIKGISNQLAINALLLDSLDQLWIATNGNGLFKYDTKKEKTIHYKKDSTPNRASINNNIVIALLEGEENRIYIGTDGGGVNLYRPEFDNFNYFQQGEGRYDLKDNAILCFYKGMHNIIWAGTVHGGLSLFKDHLDIYNIPPEELKFKKDKQGSKILEDSEGSLWITAGRDGLRKYDLNTNSVETFGAGNDENRLKSPIVLSLFEDHNKRIWIGTLRNGISIYNLRTKKFQSFPEGENLHGVYAITRISSDEIWVGTSNGIKIFNQHLEITNHINTKNCTSLSSNVIKSIYKDAKQEIWVGTRNGLNIFSKNGIHKKAFYSSDQDTTTLSGNDILSIAEGPDLSVYVGTFGFGLNRFSRQTNRFHRIGAKKGLQGNIVRGILLDHEDHIWLSTNRGLSRLIQGKIENFGSTEGIQPFHGGSASLNKDGYIYFAGSHGLSFFNPKDLKKDKQNPHVFFTHLEVTDKKATEKINIQNLKEKDELPKITLPPSHRLLTINFSSTAYTNPRDIRYSYKLKGMNDEWHSLANQKSLSFSNLKPGDYELLVTSNNKASNIASLAIQVKPFLWQRLFVQISGFILLFSLILWTLSVRNRRIKKQRDKLKIEVAIQTDKVKRERDRVYRSKLELLAKEKQNEQLKHQRLNEKLKFKTKELSNNTLRMVSKNNLLSQIKKELTLEIKKDKHARAHLKALIDKINDNFVMDADWEDFYELFNQVHPNFISNLKKISPSLTDRDLQLTALIKLGFPSKQIATLFGISLSSVKVARHRLRKKLNIPPESSFEDYFMKFKL